MGSADEHPLPALQWKEALIFGNNCPWLLSNRGYLSKGSGNSVSFPLAHHQSEVDGADAELCATTAVILFILSCFLSLTLFGSLFFWWRWAIFSQPNLMLPPLIRTIDCANTIFKDIMSLNVCFAAGNFRRSDCSADIACHWCNNFPWIFKINTLGLKEFQTCLRL